MLSQDEFDKNLHIIQLKILKNENDFSTFPKRYYQDQTLKANLKLHTSNSKFASSSLRFDLWG